MKIPKSLLLLLSTAFVGLLIASLIAPKFMAWYFQSPVTVIDCTPVLNWSIRNFLLCQLWGAGFGLVLGALIAYKAKGRGDKNIEV
ncbi:MAG TPA: hypothetical protein VM901_08060 [Bdellovibrionota bacterium]|jgi:hypothetical protein|nr:hypothetical protein [Bdellovibrionota bacterium]